MNFKHLFIKGCVLLSTTIAMPVNAQVFDEEKNTAFNINVQPSTTTTLMHIAQTTEMSERVRSFKKVAYESSQGEMLSLNDMYTPKWRDTQILFLTTLSADYGVIWGVSTGERALKYEIDPSLVLGWVQKWQITKQHSITLTAIATLGGKLKEKTCSADYGDIAGVQEVNCRLAASWMPPAETLTYLSNKRPTNNNKIAVKWQMTF